MPERRVIVRVSCVETPEVLAARALTACSYPWRRTERKMPLSAMKEAFFNGAGRDGWREKETTPEGISSSGGDVQL